MSEPSFQPDDPTQPIRPSSYSQPQGYNQGPQGKMIIGSFQDQPQKPQRQPYQYRPSEQPPSAAQYGRYPQEQTPWQQVPSVTPPPMVNPNAARYSPPQYGQRAGQRSRGKRRQRRGRGCLIGSLVALLLACILGSLTVTTTQRVLAFGSNISTQSPLSTQTGYMNTSDRTNILVMGYGGGTHDGAFLTDSLVIVSMLPQNRHTSLVSVPRDLWVQYPPSSGNYTKINAIYTAASNNNTDQQAGGEAIDQKISLITGMDVKYWLTIDFTGFKKVIDAIGGINVAVPDSFNACYPRNDDAAVDPGWIKAEFNKGVQHMDGATAIMYARAREPLEVCGMGTSENLAELTDFGRSARQQIIIKAVLAQVKQASTWPHLYDAMDALQKTIRTNMSLADLSAFALKMDLNDPKAAHIGLSNQNVLEDGQSDDGQYILKPANGDWNAIPAYVQQHLYN